MFKVYEVDYNNRTWIVGKADTIKEAKKIAKGALKKSNGEYPCFVTDGEKVVGDIR